MNPTASRRCVRHCLVRDPSAPSAADARRPGGLTSSRAAGRGSAPAARPPPPLPRPRSVLLVTIDTLRADRLGCYGDTRGAHAPDRRPGRRRARSSSARTRPSPITLPAHASLLTGLLPPAHGVRGNGAFALARAADAGRGPARATACATAAFVGGFPLARRFGLARGFDHYDDRDGRSRPASTTSSPSAARTPWSTRPWPGWPAARPRLRLGPPLRSRTRRTTRRRRSRARSVSRRDRGRGRRRRPAPRRPGTRGRSRRWSC